MIQIVAERASRVRRVLILLQFIRERQRTFAIGSVITVALSGVSIIVSAIGSILVARALGPEQLGYLVLFNTGTNTIVLFADIVGLYWSNAYLVARNEHGFDMPTIRGTVLAYGALVGSIAGGILGLTQLRLALFPRFEHEGWGIALALNVLGLVMSMQIKGLLLGRSNFLALGLFGLAQNGLFTVGAVIAIYGLGARSGLDLAGVRALSSLFCLLIVLLPLIHRGISWLSVAYVTACFGVGWRAVVANWLGFLNLRVDQYLVSWLLGQRDLGLYGVAVTIGELLTRVPGLLGTVVFPLVASDRDYSDAARKTLKRTTITMMAVTIISVPVVLFSTPIIRLFYGEEFIASARLFQLLAPAVIFMSGLAIINNHLAGLGYPMAKILALAMALGINLVGNVVLLPAIGILGAPITSSLSYFIWFIIVLWYLQYSVVNAKGGR